LFSILVKGILIGFSIAAPVGPIGVLCIRRTLNDGRLTGFVSGLGAATADATYGLIAAFGLTFISDLLLNQRLLISLVGGVFLIYLGIKTWRARPATEAAEVAARRGLLGAYASTLGLTLTNPTTILSFVAIFAGLGAGQNQSGNYAAASVLVLGVFCGSALWWFTLSGGVSLLRSRFNARWMLWVNRLSSAIIVAFGAWSLGKLI
jgi:threonine/homoserine/homoserine lactone efflux protein